MSFLRRRAIWFAGVVSLFAFASIGATLVVHQAASTETGRTSVHQVVDHEALVSVRPQADRSPLELRSGPSKLLLLAWASVLFIAALLARTAGRSVELRLQRVGTTASTRGTFVRGPPVSVCI